MEDLASLTTLASAGVAIWKTEKLQKEIYGDLLKPGIAQVGKAIGTLIGVGNAILLPLRIMNGSADLFEKVAIQKLAEKLSKIPQEKIIEISPEIGIPILDKLSFTKDENLQNLFVNLLASAAYYERARYAHPGFVKIIESISPDEAKVLKTLAENPYPGCVSIIRSNEKGLQILQSALIAPPEGCSFPENISAYVSNLCGLGLIEVDHLRWEEGEEYYRDVMNYVRKIWPEATLGLDHGFTKDDGLIAAKKILSVTEFGRLFFEGCIVEGNLE